MTEKTIFNPGDYDDAFGEFLWQYDIDALVSKTTDIDYQTGNRYIVAPYDEGVAFWAAAEECVRPRTLGGISLLVYWAARQYDIDVPYVERQWESGGDTYSFEVIDVDEQALLDALTDVDEDGKREWKGLTDSEVEDIIRQYCDRVD